MGSSSTLGRLGLLALVVVAVAGLLVMHGGLDPHAAHHHVGWPGLTAGAATPDSHAAAAAGHDHGHAAEADHGDAGGQSLVTGSAGTATTAPHRSHDELMHVMALCLAVVLAVSVALARRRPRPTTRLDAAPGPPPAPRDVRVDQGLCRVALCVELR